MLKCLIKDNNNNNSNYMERSYLKINKQHFGIDIIFFIDEPVWLVHDSLLDRGSQKYLDVDKQSRSDYLEKNKRSLSEIKTEFQPSTTLSNPGTFIIRA